MPTSSQPTVATVSLSWRAVGRTWRCAMNFAADIHQWRALADFVSYLQSIPRPSWVSGITVHNTYVPNEQQWRGQASMNGMRQTYISKGWTAGPHLYLAAECLNPSDAGIWQMTPIQSIGIHAGPCNSHYIGIENVADWQARPPTEAQYGLLMDVLVAFCRTWGLAAGDVKVHKECMPGRTCPGQYMPADKLRSDLAARLAATGVYRFPPLAVYERADLTGKVAQYLPSDSQADIEIDATTGPGYAPTAGHLRSGAGFVDLMRLVKS